MIHRETGIFCTIMKMLSNCRLFILYLNVHRLMKAGYGILNLMNAKNQLKQEGVPRGEWPSEAEIVQNVGFEWLARKGEQYGFSVDEHEVRADGYRQERFYKAKGKHHVNISTVDFTGLLTVTDPERFQNALYRGIGPAKSFGCGLMLVRRP
jgi:CRISPR system Cascade subunit CasE